MADDIAINASPSAAQPVATETAAPSLPVNSPDPVVTAPVVEPVTPDVAPAEPVIVEPAVDAPKVDAPAEEPGLLTPEPEKPVDAPQEGEVKEGEEKVDDAPSDEPAPLPTYEPFDLPEGITVEDERLSEFTNTLAEFERTTKASHEEVQKLGQSLVNRHIAEVQLSLDRQRDALVHEWNERKKDWVSKFESDPEIGGNRKETSLREAKEFIKTHGGKPEQINAFYNALKETGADSHPEIIRFLLNVKNSSSFKTPQQLPAAKPVPQVTSKIAKRYGSTS